jgi:pyruvate kinase
MDCARINCAHDDAEAWTAMAANVRAAAERHGRPCRILMDVGGPKLRTGALPPAEAVLKLRPARDPFGRVLAPWCACLGRGPAPPGMPLIELDGGPPPPGTELTLTDARGARRRCTVGPEVDGGAVLTGDRTAYLVPGSELVAQDGCRFTVAAVPERPGQVRLQTGDTLHVIAPGADPPTDVAWVPCTLPEVFADVRAGEAIVFDDGRIGGRVLEARADRLVVRIRHAVPGGAKLRADKGINLPDSRLRLSALTEEDRAALPFVARHADLLGLSFVHRDRDIAQARALLDANGGAGVGLVLKIETPRAFRRLPELLLAAMALPGSWGVMIARGDLAVECGFERLAEVQEEILWLCEAAHTPVIWATQVLEGMAKTGLASRAEITDAAMGVRAECVMLNKGPSILDALQTLDDVLRRMGSHQHKKTALLRRLAPFGDV